MARRAGCCDAASSRSSSVRSVQESSRFGRCVTTRAEGQRVLPRQTPYREDRRHGWLRAMPDVELERLESRPDPKVHAVYEYAEPLEPLPDQRGDDNWVCGHCHAVVVRGIRAGIEPLAPVPGLVFRCPTCGKYNLFRMSPGALDREFAEG
jgi:hypothetical protein